MTNAEQRSKTAHYVGVVYLISLILPVLSSFDSQYQEAVFRVWNMNIGTVYLLSAGACVLALTLGRRFEKNLADGERISRTLLFMGLAWLPVNAVTDAVLLLSGPVNPVLLGMLTFFSLVTAAGTILSAAHYFGSSMQESSIRQ